MSARNRLRQYIEPTISTEGLVDVLKKVFSPKSKPGINPFDAGSGGWVWLRTAESDAKATLANLTWVKKHLKSHTLNAPKLAASLSYRGVVPKSPDDVIANVRHILSELKRYHHAVETYATALTSLENAAKSWPGTGDEIGARLIVEAKKIKLPFKKGDKSPELFNGERSEMSGPWGVESKSNDHYKVDSGALPALTAEDIVKTTVAVFQLMHEIVDLWVVAGSGCDYGVWDKLEYDSSYGEELWDLMYDQAMPEVQGNLLTDPLYTLSSETLFSTMKWVYSQVSQEPVSVESIDGNDSWVSYL